MIKFFISLLTFCGFFCGPLCFSGFAQGSFHLGGHTSYRTDVPNAALFGRPIPSIFRLGVMGLYHSSGPLGITAHLSYRQEFGQVTEREVGPGFGLDGLEWKYHFFNPEVMLGYRVVLKSGVGVTLQAGLGANFPIWGRTISLSNSGQLILTEGPLERELGNQYLLLGFEMPVYAARGYALTIQPEYARPFQTNHRLRPTHELGFSLIIRGGGV